MTYPCDLCYEEDCKHCWFGNPCYQCDDYDEENDTCKSKGGCAPDSAKIME